MNTLKGIGLIVLGIIILYTTYSDGKTRKPELSTGYIMHLKGYIGGIGLIIIGIMMLYR